MEQQPSTLVYLEIGAKRVLAGALDWPGWCRGGRDEGAALAALAAYAPRYARVLAAAHIRFDVGADAAAFSVAERLDGDSGTDFGAPSVAPAYDAQPLDATALEGLLAILGACWGAFQHALDATENATLRTGPRGGGRDHAGVALHMLNAERSYLARLNTKAPPVDEANLKASLRAIRQAAFDAVERAADGGLPASGPRGGKIWASRYFVRRSAWHLLDHTWELEDRAE